MAETKYCILADEARMELPERADPKEAAVLVHLHYEDQTDYYMDYLKRIPPEIDVYVSASGEGIRERIRERLGRECLGRVPGLNFRFLPKENRGRDISALLICGRELVSRYKYLCFVHDKREKNAPTAGDVRAWVRNLWDNTLGSGAFILNTLDYLESHPRLGLLLPLPPHNETNSLWLRAEWGHDYENTVALGKKLGLGCEIKKDESLVSYSTTFWARTDALKKLYGPAWSYSDFPEEPLPADGVLNHAVERIFQYVAEDAGYQTEILLSSAYAADFLQSVRTQMQMLTAFSFETSGVLEIADIRSFRENKERITAYYQSHEKVYIYGAGKIGKQCLAFLRRCSIFPESFLVSGTPDAGELEGIPVQALSETLPGPESGSGILIAVAYRTQQEIAAYLEQKGYQDYCFYLGGNEKR